MMRYRSFILVSAALAASLGGALASGCGGSEGEGATDNSGATASNPTPSGPTYHQDVAPVLSENCGGCHVAKGIAPFALMTYEEASVTAGLIKSAVSTRDMPPWPPGPESPAIEHDRSLTQEQIDTLVAWVDAGAPAGDASAAAPLPPPETIDIGPTEVSKDIGTDYVPDAQYNDDYHCFPVDLGMLEDRVATGYRIIPGNGKTVHHVTTSLFDASSKAALDALDAETPDVVGWPCFGGVQNVPGADAMGSIGAWVPGVSAVNYPEGTGRPIPSGAIAVLQVHYNLAGGTDPDRTRLELALAPKAEEASLAKLASVRLAKLNLDIPAGEASVVAEQEFSASQWTKGKFYPDGDGYILTVSGHMHLLGRSFSITVTSADGARKVLDIPGWDFHWQGSYELAEPIKLKADDKLSIRCEYDNSEAHRMAQGLGPPVDVKWGEGTGDEMCLGSLGVVDNLPAAK